jgi:hypothetical protein
LGFGSDGKIADLIRSSGTNTLFIEAEIQDQWGLQGATGSRRTNEKRPKAQGLHEANALTLSESDKLRMDEALDTPELLRMILSGFSKPVKPKDLLDCALVSKTWSWIALELLWRREDYNGKRLKGRELVALGKMMKSQIEVWFVVNSFRR